MAHFQWRDMGRAEVTTTGPNQLLIGVAMPDVSPFNLLLTSLPPGACEGAGEVHSGVATPAGYDWLGTIAQQFQL